MNIDNIVWHLHAVTKEQRSKPKEISCIHARFYPAGELNHVSLALIDDNMARSCDCTT
jgi:glucosamine 6-phosphate synthetase-like amidotransferase/phosphosugar isomerase protein